MGSAGHLSSTFDKSEEILNFSVYTNEKRRRVQEFCGWENCIINKIPPNKQALFAQMGFVSNNAKLKEICEKI